jgi:predicted RNase H-like nuclease (RuvC/YqgF family)
MELKSDLFNSNKKCEEYDTYAKVLQTQNDDLGRRLIGLKEDSDNNMLQKMSMIRELEKKLFEIKTDRERCIQEFNVTIKELEIKLNQNKMEFDNYKRNTDDTIRF